MQLNNLSMYLSISKERRQTKFISKQKPDHVSILYLSLYPSIYLEGCHPLNASLSCIFSAWCVTLDSILPGIHCQTIIELFPGILSLHSFSV